MEVFFYLSTYGFLFLSCRKLCPFITDFHLKVVAKIFVLCFKYLKKVRSTLLSNLLLCQFFKCFIKPIFQTLSAILFTHSTVAIKLYRKNLKYLSLQVQRKREGLLKKSTYKIQSTRITKHFNVF